MTNLLMGYPDIPARASAPSLSGGSEATLTPVKNIITGSRADMFSISSAAGVIEITSDLGTSLTASIEYLFIARANILKAQGATKVLLQSSSNGSAWTDRIGTTSDLQDRTFTGPRSEDLIFVSGFNDDVSGSLPTSAYRYWKLLLGATSPTKKWAFSKAFYGSFFDFGSEPQAPNFIYASNRSYAQEREPKQVFTLTWKGITNTKRNEFIDKIYRNKDSSPVVLYDPADAIFLGHKTIHARIIDADFVVENTQANTITVNFEECT